MVKRIAAIALAALAAGCMSYMDEEDEVPGPISLREEQRLAAELRDKVPGPPQSCITRHEADRMDTIGNDTLLFRVSGSLVYRNGIPGGCPMAGASRRLERRSIGTNLCRGEPLHVVDNQTGTYYGTCVLGDFIPYRRR